MPAYPFIYCPGPSSPVSLLPAGCVSVRSLMVPAWFVRSFFSCGCRFYRFPVPVSDCFPVVFHSCGCCFVLFSPFPVRFLPWSSLVRGLCVIAFRLFPSRSSRLGIRCGGAGRECSFRGVGVCPVARCCGDGGASCRFCLVARFLRCGRRGVLVGFFCMEL